MADEKKIIEEVSGAVVKLTEVFKGLQEVINGNLTQQEQLIQYMTELKDAIGSSKELKDFVKLSAEMQKTQQALAKTQSDAIKIQQEAEKLRQQEIKTQQATTNALKAEEQQKQAIIRTEEASARQKNRLSKEAEKATRESEKAKSAYQQESARLLELTKRAKDAAVQYGVNSKQAKSLRQEQQKLDKSIKAVDSSLGIHNRNVGNYGSALQGVTGKLLGAFGIVGGVRMFTNALKDGMKVAKDYEATNAELGAILGTPSDTLKTNSLELGRTTAFTATQVTELQIELARLGKTEEEIIDMTEGIINATLALGGSTADTAALVGATLNAYQMSAKESGKVGDILTLSTQRTALSFEKLKTALPTVAGAASAVGVSLEELVAQLGQAADRGIDASTSATSLRNIYIQLADKGITYDEALEQINESQDKLNTAVKLFGVRASVTGLALADTRGKAKDLARELGNAGGTAENVATQKLNTLDGSLKLLSSAWEGFILSVFDANGSIMGLVKGVVDLTTGIFGLIDKLINTSRKLTDVESAISSVNERYDEATDLLEEGNKAREILIDALLEEGLSYAEAEKEADKYLKTLEAINEGLWDKAALGLQIDMLKTQVALLEATGAPADVLIKKQEELRNLTDQLQFSQVKLNKATDEELQNYLKMEDNILFMTDAKRKFLAEVRKEIALRAELNSATAEEVSVETDLIKIQEALLKQAREMPGRTEREVAARNNKIKIIELEIKRLKELGAVRKAEADLNIESIIKDEEDNAKDLEAIDQRGIDAYLDAEIEKTNILRRALKERQELEKEAAKSAFALQKAVVSAIFESKNEQYENDLEANSKYYDELLSNEELSLEQRALFEAQRVEKENQIRADQRANEKKQFLFEQAMKVGEIVMNTSLAIAKTTAAYAAIPGGALIAAPIIGLIKTNAALQIGTVLAQSIPKFAKGTMNAPEGLAIVGERGTELKITPKGEASFTPSTASLDYLEKGTKIIPNHDLVDMINRYSTASIINEGILVSNNDILIANALLELKKENKNNNEKLLKALSKDTKTKDNSIDRMRKNALQKKIEGKNLYN